MSDYTKTTNFAAKDSLPSGNSGKIVKGSEIDTEFTNIQTAVATKLNINDSALTGATSVQTLTVSTLLDITSTTDASDATGDTGALRTEGGASIAKKLFVGTDLDVDGTTNLDVVDIDGAVNMASTALVTGVLTTTAATVHTNGITMPDNAKAIFGAGSDLQIYHDGSNSYVADSGTGRLFLSSDGDGVNIVTSTGENLIRTDNDGQVRVYFDNSEKLRTNSTGLDVTGTVTADGLTVDGDVSVVSALPRIILEENDTTDLNTVIRNNGGVFKIQTVNDAANSFTSRIDLDHSTGDISFYEDTGTTPKLFWDASAESLGIGTTSPAEPLHVQEGSSGITSKSGTIALIEGSGNSKLSIASGTTSTGELLFGSSADNDAGRIIYDHSNDGLQVWTNGSRAVDVDSSGRVGIGTTSPATTLDVTGDITLSDTANPTLTITDTTNTTTLFLEAANLSTTVGTSTDHPLKFDTNNTERMRIDASGNLLVGKTSTGDYVTGIEMQPAGAILSYRTGGVASIFGRTDIGEITRFTRNGSIVGSIGTTTNSYLHVGGTNTGIFFYNNGFGPCAGSSGAGALNDGTKDIGASGNRFKDLYRSGSTYSTSDRTMKQDIRDLTDAERNVAVAAKGLLKAFRFIDTVAAEGDSANIHFGVIAQELAEAFAAEGLDANDYQVYKSATTTDDEGNEQTRLNVCYENLLAFIISAI